MVVGGVVVVGGGVVVGGTVVVGGGVVVGGFVGEVELTVRLTTSLLMQGVSE